jgi:signal transduction histidine kinase
MQRLRVLLVEDDEDDAFLVRGLLARVSTVAYDVEWVRDWGRALESIEQPTHDACLLDYRLGGHDGVEFLRRARERGYPAPILVLTGHGERAIDEEALAAGAADFLTKSGLTGAAVDRALRYAIGHRQVLEALRESERQRTRLSAELLEAQEKERRAVAREIHDSIGQTLAAATYVLESTLDPRPGGCGPGAGEMVSRVIGMLRDVIEETTRLQAGLQPAMLDSAGIGPTLAWFCEEFGKSYPLIRVRPRIAVDESAVPAPLKPTLFRIAQEAFNNVAKHSGADEVRLELAAEGDGITLTVEDNGRGFAADGRGLVNMRERALLSGGTFRLDSRPGHGTRLSFAWPGSGP